MAKTKRQKKKATDSKSTPTKNEMAKTQKKARRKPRRAGRGGGNYESLISRSGFLRCAFAPNDYAGTKFSGIPDSYAGKVFNFSTNFTDQIVVPAGQILYTMLAPSPGVACYRTTAQSSTTQPASAIYVASYYQGFDQIFPTPATLADTAEPLVSQFRMVSNTLELTNVTTNLNQGGYITALDIPLKFSQYQTGISANSTQKVYYGLNGMPSTMNGEVYIDKGQNGIYTVAANTSNEFAWSEVMNGFVGGEGALEKNIVPFSESTTFGLTGAPLSGQSYSWSLRGWDDSFNTKLVRITAPADQPQTYVLKTTTCFECRPDHETLMARLSHSSPDPSPIEIAAYFAMARELPIAVPRNQNDGFWDFVLKSLRRFTGVMSAVPGPVGMISQGVNQLVM